MTVLRIYESMLVQLYSFSSWLWKTFLFSPLGEGSPSQPSISNFFLLSYEKPSFTWRLNYSLSFCSRSTLYVLLTTDTLTLYYDIFMCLDLPRLHSPSGQALGFIRVCIPSLLCNQDSIIFVNELMDVFDLITKDTGSISLKRHFL